MNWRRWVGGGMAAVLAVGLLGLVGRAEDGQADNPPPIMARATLTVQGAKQGFIAGGRGQKPIVPLGFEHEVKAPRDVATGQASGRRQHQPLTIIKQIDKTTPLLFRALVSNENLPMVVLHVQMAMDESYEIKLTNAVISDVKQHMDRDAVAYEEISFVYQKIEWTYSTADGKTTAMDDWHSRK